MAIIRARYSKRMPNRSLSELMYVGLENVSGGKDHLVGNVNKMQQMGQKPLTCRGFRGSQDLECWERKVLAGDRDGLSDLNFQCLCNKTVRQIKYRALRCQPSTKGLI